MIHDPALVDRLSQYSASPYAGDAYRAARVNLDPLAPSTSGGRWMPKGEVAVLYASCERDGALAELAFHWSQITPFPTKPAVIHFLRVGVERMIRFEQLDLEKLGVERARYGDINYERTQVIGAAAAFLGFDGLIVPSARWRCENLILFANERDLSVVLEVVDTEPVDLRAWAAAHGMIE